MKFAYIIFLVLILIFACGTNPEEPIDTNDVKTTLSQTLDTTAIDTIAIEQKILSNFAEEYTYYNDSLNKEVSAIHYNIAVEFKFNFNGDQWRDYFLVDAFGGGVSAAYIYDGATGLPIEGEIICSGPGRDITGKVLDVNCTDTQEELLVISGGGGTAGLYYTCDIYRYDTTVNTIRKIFSETISSESWIDEANDPLVNYINVIYDDFDCEGEIIVQQGERYETENFDATAIKPSKQSQTYHYIYDDSEDRFVLDREQCVGQTVTVELQNQIEKLNDWQLWEEEPDKQIERIDIVGDGLVELLREGLITITEDMEALAFTASLDGRINIINYNYPSGGTAGTIHNCILQYRKAAGTYGVKKLYPHQIGEDYFGSETNYYSVYQLPDKNLYLLIGSNKGGSNSYYATASVIAISNDTVVFDYPAFLDNYAVLQLHDDLNDEADYCIACIDYDSKNHTLSIPEVDDLDQLIVRDSKQAISEIKSKELNKKGTVVFVFSEGKFHLQ